MKKRYLTVLIILISLILTFSFSSRIFAEDLIHGVVPTKVTGHSTGTGQSKDIGILEFWNVGKLGGEQYSKATYIVTREGKTIASWEGYFTGGPNGDIYLSGDTELHGKLEDGKQLVSESGGIVTIDNPEAFDGWTDEETITAPTIGLSILEGPVDSGGGKLSWTVKAFVTGNPAPTVEFSGDPSDGISATDNENIINITVQKGKIFELTATASNWFSTKTVTMTFVNEDSGARFSDITGQVEIRPDNDPEAWTSAKLNSKLYTDYHIKTFENSTVILSFSDASLFVMKPETEIVLSSPSVRDSNLKLLWGNMMLNIKHLLKYGNLPVEMSQGVSGIKGTILVLSEAGTESTVKVIEGIVEFKLLDSNKSVMVSKGESVTASKNGLSEKTIFDPAEELISWETITGKTIETAGDNQADTIKETAESADKTQGDTIQETTDTNIQKTSTQFSVLYIVLIILGVLIVLTAAVLVLVIVKRKKK